MKRFKLLGLLKFLTRRNCSSQSKTVPEKSLRNIGIMAHIDAGKTTTTERMLYYSGRTQNIGEVHDGDTVTDYMDQERSRGITITSAAISFPWRENHINLIDTPGHVDFTVEVERALRVLDGAIAVFDASAGVEAQSLTVWRQADRYSVPRICYLNKMDKPMANLKMCLESIEEKLHTKPLLLQLPLGNGHSFRGVIDLMTMAKFEWDPTKKNYGATFDYRMLDQSDGELYEQAMQKRSELTEQICDLDNNVAEAVLEKESTDNIPSALLRNAVRQITINRLGVPLLMGSSYKNMGVQPLLDAVSIYLPSPIERQHTALKVFGSHLCAIVFKILHHRQLGQLTFVRIYSGMFKQGQKIYNVNRSVSEKPGKMYIPYADDFEAIESAGLGSIVVLTGLKSTITGDTLTSSEKGMVLKKSGDVSEHKLMGVSVPEPVFMCSIEAPSPSQQVALEEALSRLQREDPSLRVKMDPETGQTVLSGMGELHIEIIRDRIRDEYKVDVDLGPLEVSYRESLQDTEPHTLTFEKIISGEAQRVVITLDLVHKPNHVFRKAGLKHSTDTQENLNRINRKQMAAINRGVASALSCGPLLGYPVIDVDCRVLYLEVSRRTAETSIAAAASQCIAELIRSSSCFLMEPVMNIELTTPASKSHELLGDLNRRRAQVNNTDHKNNLEIIQAECPLSELVGYSSCVRMLSSGLATISLEFAFYRVMSTEEQDAIAKRLNPFGSLS